MMKRIFTFTVLMLAFAMNAVAWEPVIKETHWFGMHEFYESPIPTAPIDCYFVNTDLSRTNGWDESGTNGWEASSTANGWTVSKSNSANIYFCKIGEGDDRYKITVANTQESPSSRDLWPATDAIFHTKDTRCVVFTARWGNGSCAITQTTTKKLLKGTYRLKYDIQNANNDYTDHGHTYQNLFSVTIGGTEIKDNNTDWINSGTWSTHSIEFTVDGNQDVTISLGYGTTTNTNPSQMHTPVLFVSNLYLETVSVERDPRITWNGNYIESISVVKDWTGKRPSQQPQTLYYSWIDHQYRFSMNHPEQWSIGRNNNPDYKINNSKGEAIYGIGLYNESQTAFKILNLKQGDQFCVEYYLDPNTSDASAYLANGNGEMNATVQERVTDQEQGINTITSSEYYTISSEGRVQIMMPAKTILRSVTIIHKNYKKATYNITEVTDEDSNKGYKYTLTGAGVLEDKRGAVPYITMRFGADNDMTFVKKLGDGDNAEFGAVSIVDETNDFNPTTARLQSAYQSLSEAEAKDRLAGKEWTVFSTDLDANGDIFRSILPHYGTYYYFFPEVNGKLSLRFYCEGSYEHMPFWFKSKNGEIVDDLTRSIDTDGRYYYEYNDINVEKGGVYYLCSNPTIVQHELPIVRLISYSFIPTFHVEPLHDVIGNGSNGVSEVSTIKGVTISEFTGLKSGDGYVLDNDATITINGEDAPRVKFLGNVKDANIYLTQQANDNIKLNFSNITYKDVENVNQGGAIVAILDCPAGRATFVLTIAYDAANKNPDGTAVSTLVKKWDFYSGAGDGADGGWDLGKYGSGNYPLYDPTQGASNTNFFNSPKIWKETHKADGLTADWVNTYVNIADGKNERIFKSVYDMDGDNADMIHETAGLVFISHANQLGIYNENDEPTTQFQDRYIGLMKGSKFTIPLLEAGDRIVLKMGTYNNESVTLGMTNAKDVSSEGKTIGNNYIIGGSAPVSGDVKDAKGHVVPRGEYHIQAIANGDVDIEVVEGQLLKLYTIEIYCNAANDNADILTENEVTTADGPELLFTDDDDENKDMEFFLRYSGYGEPKEFGNYDPKYTRGNLGSLNAESFKAGSTPYSKKVSFKNTDFGSFRAVAQVKTTDAANTYVTDYAKGSLAVDYLKKVDDGYPYTWDFTDLLTVSNEYVKNAIGQEEGSSTLPDDYKGWTEKNGSCLRNAPENESGVLFANGGQLYASTTMFAETAGLGFKRSTDDAANAKKQNNSVTLVSGGTEGMLKVDHPTDNNEFTKIVIPKVDANAAIYIRATPIEHATVKAQYSTDGLSGQDLTLSDVTYPVGSSDKIYAMKNDGEQRNVELWLNGLAIKKIAVSTAPKKLNAKGWATESREYVTDPALTAYMTGKDIRTYIVTEVDYKNKQVTLERIDAESGNTTFQGYLMPAATDDDNNASILLNFKSKGDKGIEGEPVSLIDDGFHIFVPDMHDAKDKVTWSSVHKNNYLVSQVSGSEESPAEIPAVKNGFTNFAFTSTYVDIDPETGAIKSDPKTGAQAFYRIAGGTNAKAKSKGHQGYLPIKIEENTDGAARFNLMIIDGDEATGVTSLEQVAEDNGRYFNLNGQQLSGKPNRSGLYIVNGKKVYVKNK